MAPDQEVVRILKAYVDTGEGGMVAVPKGEPLPPEAIDGEADRLRALGALGAPIAVVQADSGGAPGDEVDALATGLTEAAITDYVREHNVKEIVAAVGDNVELAKKVLVAEADATGNESRGTLVKALQAVVQADSGGAPGESTSTDPEA